MRDAARPARGVLGVVVLLVLFLVVNGWWRDYRGVGENDEREVETTETVEPSAEETPPVEERPEDGEEGIRGTVVVLIDGLNFRKEPTREGAVIRGLSREDRLTHLATENGWYHVRDEDGLEGYVSASPQYSELRE